MNDEANTAQETKQWYDEYYKKKGMDRNSLLLNPEVLFQTLAFESSVIQALRSTKIDPSEAQVLDVGCGTGGSFFNLFRLGFDPSRMFGIDIIEDRILEGRKKCPHVNLSCADASNMEFSDNYFDIVTESTMFVQLTDNSLSECIAMEMLRVVKHGGFP